MYEVTKFIYLYRTRGTPESTEKGSWETIVSGHDYRPVVGPRVTVKEYKLTYTKNYADESEYELDREALDAEFYAGLLSVGYDEKEASEILKNAKTTSYYSSPTTFRDWRGQQKSQQTTEEILWRKTH